MSLMLGPNRKMSSMRDRFYETIYDLPGDLMSKLIISYEFPLFRLSRLFLAKNISPTNDPPLRLVVFLKSSISVWCRILLFLETIDA